MRKKVNIPILIFGLALVLRLAFILPIKAGTPAHSWTDVWSFNDSANAIHGILSHPGIFLREFLSAKLGKGNAVLNSYGLRLPFGIFYRGAIHPLFIAVVYLFFGLNNAKAVWIAQGVIDSLSCVLVYSIGKRLFSRKSAILAAILAALYAPFIHYTMEYLQETLIIFLLLSSILLFVKAIQDKSKPGFFWAGISLFLVTTGRVAYIYWFVVVFALLGYILFKEHNAVLFKRAFGGLTAGFLLPLLFWMSLVARESGKFGKILIGPGALNLYLYNNVLTGGWQADENRLSLGPHLTQRLKEQGFVWDDKNNKWPPDDVLFKAEWRDIQEKPQAYFELFLEKVRVLWLGNVGSNALIQALHQLAVLLLVMSIPLAFFSNRLSILLSGLIIYVTLMHGLVSTEPRYNLPAMPFVFLLSGFGLSCLWKSPPIQNREIRRKTILFCALGVGAYLSSRILTVPVLLLILNRIRPAAAFAINIVLKNFFLLFITIAVYFYLFSALARSKKIVSAVFPCFVFVVFLNSWAIYHKSWRQWTAALSGSHKGIRQEIKLTKDYLERAKEAYLKIDMQQSRQPMGKLVLLVNDEPVKTYSGKLTVDGKPFPGYFEYRYMTVEPARMRRWFSIPVEISLLRKLNPVKIEMLYENTPDSKKGYINVYGDYPLNNSDKFFAGPLFARSDFETSILKYSYDGDYRLNGTVRLKSLATQSNFSNGRSWTARDLSPRPGIQTGYYRIRLEIIDNQGNSLIF